MKRLPVTYRAAALYDLEDIYRGVYRISLSHATAEGFVARIRSRCLRIGDAPRGGRPRDDLWPGLRTVPFEKSGVIAYLVEPARVRIVNIFIGGQDYEALYRNFGAPDGDQDTGAG